MFLKCNSTAGFNSMVAVGNSLAFQDGYLTKPIKDKYKKNKAEIAQLNKQFANELTPVTVDNELAQAVDTILGSLRPISVEGKSLKFVSPLDNRRDFVLGTQITINGKSDLESDWEELLEHFTRNKSCLMNQIIRIVYCDNKFNIVLASVGIEDNMACNFRDSLMFRLAESGFYPELDENPFITRFELDNPNYIILHSNDKVWSLWSRFFEKGMDYVHTKYTYKFLRHGQKTSYYTLPTNYIGNVIALSSAVNVRMHSVTRLRSNSCPIKDEIALLPLVNQMIVNPDREYTLAELKELTNFKDKQLEKIRNRKALLEYNYPYEYISKGNGTKHTSQFKLYEDRIEKLKQRVDFVKILAFVEAGDMEEGLERDAYLEKLHDIKGFNSLSPELSGFISSIYNKVRFIKDYNKTEKETIALMEKEDLTEDEQKKLDKLLTEIDLETTQRRIANMHKTVNCFKRKKEQTEKQAFISAKYENRKKKLERLEKKVYDKTLSYMLSTYGSVAEYVKLRQSSDTVFECHNSEKRGCLLSDYFLNNPKDDSFIDTRINIKDKTFRNVEKLYKDFLGVLDNEEAKVKNTVIQNHYRDNCISIMARELNKSVSSLKAGIREEILPKCTDTLGTVQESMLLFV